MIAVPGARAGASRVSIQVSKLSLSTLLGITHGAIRPFSYVCPDALPARCSEETFACIPFRLQRRTGKFLLRDIRLGLYRLDRKRPMRGERAYSPRNRSPQRDPADVPPATREIATPLPASCTK